MTMQETYMNRALALAEKGRGYTAPNPMVGCVVVKDGRIISEGWHERCGEYHAERNALLRCTEDPAGADLYVTLEPCCHYGRTPPCTEIILEKKIGRVFVGSLDCNPEVAGKGVQILRDHGVEVTCGILEEKCLRLNEVFYHFMTTKTPFVVAKYAMSLDGRIACESGDSKWVTGEPAREEVHLLRKYYSGIMVGIGTVLADDPMLNCRVESGVDPVRIICDSRMRIPLESRIIQTAREIPTILAVSDAADDPEKEAAIKKSGVEILKIAPARPETAAGRNDKSYEQSGGRNDKPYGQSGGTNDKPDEGTDGIDLRGLMRCLGERGIDSILLEGGGTLNAAAFRAGIVNKVQAYIAGKIIGGDRAPGPVRGVGADCMKDAVLLTDLQVEMVGEDIRVTGYPT